MPKLGLGLHLGFNKKIERKAIYKVTGSGLSPDINNMLFYATSDIINTKPVYSSNSGFYLFYFSPIQCWVINKTKTIGSTPQWLQTSYQGSSPTNSTYSPSAGTTGTVTVVNA